jgi:hypothetical protein
MTKRQFDVAALWGRTDWTALLCVLLIAAAGPSTAAAQSVDVVVLGVVRDQTGAPVPGALITVTNIETGLVRPTTTDRDGVYRIQPVPAGTYHVKAELGRFQTKVRTNQTLPIGATVTIDFTFDALTATETVDVLGAPTLETTKNALSRPIVANELDALPVIDRDFNGLASLAPGVTPTGIYGGVDISGSRDFQNGYNVDGVSNEGLGLGDQRIAFAQDWIQEFQVLTSQYSVEFGRASGGTINAITRSGSNVLQGRAYGYFRNESWDATPVFATSKPKLHMTRPGGMVGGRLVPDRLFFFGGVEWFDNATAAVVSSSFPAYNGSVPATSDQKMYLTKLAFHPDASTIYRVRYNGDMRKRTNVGVGGRTTEQRGTTVTATAQDLVGTWTRAINPSVFNELRTAFSTTSSDTRCNFAERNPPGTWFSRSYPNALFGCEGFGWLDSGELQWIDNLSWARGAHDFKGGVQLSRGRSHGDWLFGRLGIYTHSTDVLFDISNETSFPVGFTIIEGPSAWDFSRWTWGAFLQDSWRVRSDVTLNLGVRYDVDNGYTAINSLLRVDRGLNTVRADRDNFAPRAGVAWTPLDNAGRTLVRGGAGLYFDETHEEVARLLVLNGALAERLVVVSANTASQNPFCPAGVACTSEVLTTAGRTLRRFLAEALAENRLPDLTKLPASVSGTPDFTPNLQVPFTVQSSAGVLHTFGGGWIASADLVFARGLDQYTVRNVNLDRGAALEGRSVRLNPNFFFINQYGNGGRFDYRALQVQVSYAPRAQYFARLSYTLARNESNTNTALRGGPPNSPSVATNPFDLNEDQGPTYNDIRHNLVVNGAATLRYQIQVAGILTARSALPWTVTSSVSRDVDVFQDRPEPRNSRRGDPYCSLDMRIAKAFRLGGRRSATVLLELYNAANVSNLAGYVTALESAQFGQPNLALDPRRVQLGFRVDF